MISKNKLIFSILLFLTVFLVVYLIAQIIIPEPLTETLTNLANPPAGAAEVLVTAYLGNQPETVQKHLARTCRNRIWHLAALTDTVIAPDQAIQKHTAEINGHCLEKIENRDFFLIQMETIDQRRVRYTVYAGKKAIQGAAVLDLTMLKEDDGIWRCEKILKLQ